MDYIIISNGKQVDFIFEDGYQFSFRGLCFYRMCRVGIDVYQQLKTTRKSAIDNAIVISQSDMPHYRDHWLSVAKKDLESMSTALYASSDIGDWQGLVSFIDYMDGNYNMPRADWFSKYPSSFTREYRIVKYTADNNNGSPTSPTHTGKVYSSTVSSDTYVKVECAAHSKKVNINWKEFCYQSPSFNDHHTINGKAILQVEDIGECYILRLIEGYLPSNVNIRRLLGLPDGWAIVIGS